MLNRTHFEYVIVNPDNGAFLQDAWTKKWSYNLDTEAITFASRDGAEMYLNACGIEGEFVIQQARFLTKVIEAKLVPSDKYHVIVPGE